LISVAFAAALTAVVSASGFVAVQSSAFFAVASPTGLPGCAPDERSARHAAYEEWADTLLDPTFTLGEDYVPPDLQPIGFGRPGLRLRSFVIGDLREMFAAARRDGVTLEITSAYRSYSDQVAVHRSLRRVHGAAYAAAYSARPGHSEHQLGTAVDIAGGDEWLKWHAWQFGFSLSYPAGRSPTWTCYSPESWHYRYFGRATAAAIQNSGLSPREWLWQHSSG